MGIYSTVYVTREMAVEMLRDLVSFANFSDEELGDMLDKAYKDETLHNYIVRDSGDEA